MALIFMTANFSHFQTAINNTQLNLYERFQLQSSSAVSLHLSCNHT